MSQTKRKIGKDINNPEIGYYYKFNGNYHIYRGEWENVKNHKSGLYTKEDELIYFKSKEVKNTVLTDLEKEILSQSEKIYSSKNQTSEEDIYNSLSEKDKKNILAPALRDDDDFLVARVKEILANEQLPEKILKSRFCAIRGKATGDRDYNNFKRGLLMRPTMTTVTFEGWLEVLGYEYTLTISKK